MHAMHMYNALRVLLLHSFIMDWSRVMVFMDLTLKCLVLGKNTV